MNPLVVLAVPILLLAVVMALSFAGCADVLGLDDVEYAPPETPTQVPVGASPWAGSARHAGTPDFGPAPPDPKQEAVPKHEQEGGIPAGGTLPPYDTVVMTTPNLRHYWPLADDAAPSTRARDLGTPPDDGTYDQNALPHQQVTIGAQLTLAGAFDGANFIDVPYSLSVNPASAFTVEAWVKQNPGAPLPAVVVGSYQTVANAYKGFVLDLATSAAGAVVARARLFGNTAVGAASTAQVELPNEQDGWHYLAMTFQPTAPAAANGLQTGDLMIYVDGTVQAGPTPNSRYLPNPGKDLFIGVGNNQAPATTHSEGFAGYIARVALYLEVLDTNTILTHFLAGRQ